MTSLSTLVKAAGVVAIAIAIGWGGFHFFPLSRFLFLFVGFLGFVTLSSFVALFHARARDIATIMAAIAFGLVLIETFGLAFANQPVISWDAGSGEPKPELGWGPALAGVMRHKKVAANGKVLFDAAYTIDDSLTRKVVSASSGPTIAFFGDSFTFGDGLPDSDTFPQAFADATDHKFRVLNLAFSGYGAHQFLRALEIDEYDALLEREPRLVVMLTAPWHAYRSSCEVRWPVFGPSYVLENGEPVYRGPCYARRSRFIRQVQEFLRSSAAHHYFIGSRNWPIDRAEMDLHIAILVKAGAVARQKYGVPTLIVYLPEHVDYAGPGYDHEEIKRKLREGGLLVIDGGIDPRDYPGQDLLIPGEGHPTGLANRIRAQRVKDFIATNRDAPRSTSLEGAR